MKTLLFTVVLAATLASLTYAGPLRVATYPVVHPVKTTHAIGHAGRAVAKGTFVAAKTLLW